MSRETQLPARASPFRYTLPFFPRPFKFPGIFQTWWDRWPGEPEERERKGASVVCVCREPHGREGKPRHGGCEKEQQGRKETLSRLFRAQRGQVPAGVTEPAQSCGWGLTPPCKAASLGSRPRSLSNPLIQVLKLLVSKLLCKLKKLLRRPKLLLLCVPANDLSGVGTNSGSFTYLCVTLFKNRVPIPC